MLYVFKQSVHLAGRDYPRGTHEVPEKAESHPHFLKYVKAGFIVEADTKVAVTLETTEQRRAKLLNKIVTKQNSERGAKVAKKAPENEEAPNAEVPQTEGVVAKVDEEGNPEEVKLDDGEVAVTDKPVPAKPKSGKNK